MTVSTTASRISYSGNGVTTAFAFPYKFIADADLVVVLVDSAGTATTQTISTHYTVSGAGTDSSGQVTMITAPASGETLVVYRSTEIDQETDYIAGDAFPAETHEGALDKLTLVAQEIDTKVNRSFVLADSDASNASTILPSPEALKYFRWNSAGNALELTSGTTSVLATDVTFAPAGSISATEVQAALEELDAEKEPADATILKDADIGSTVQAYDADTLKADTADTLTASFRGTVTTDNDLSFDMNVTNHFACTPTAGGTLTFTNITAGQTGMIKLVNGSNYAISAAATTKISATNLSAISVTGTYILNYFSDGTNVYVVASENLA